jgi:hypothetical protein
VTPSLFQAYSTFGLFQAYSTFGLFQASSTFGLFQASSTFYPKMTAVESLATDFAKMWSDDPVMQALWDGSMLWGDIPGILSTRTRSASVCSEEPDLLALLGRSSAMKSHTSINKEAPVRHAVAPPPIPLGRLTVITRNLPRDINVEQLRTVFEKYGPIRDIYIPKNADKNSPYFGTIKGFALIKFIKPTDSARAYQSEYGRLTIGKNNITVEFAKEDR